MSLKDEIMAKGVPQRPMRASFIKLWQNLSGEGKPYLKGNMGNLQIVFFPSSNTAPKQKDDGSMSQPPHWYSSISEKWDATKHSKGGDKPTSIQNFGLALWENTNDQGEVVSMAGSLNGLRIEFRRNLEKAKEQNPELAARMPDWIGDIVISPEMPTGSTKITTNSQPNVSMNTSSMPAKEMDTQQFESNKPTLPSFVTKEEETVAVEIPY